MPRILLIFFDGVGIGEARGTNPFFSAKADYLPFFPGGSLPDGTPVKPIDALLGVPGLPQSATGQTALFTGVNVPGRLNRHQGSFPNKVMRKIIREENLLSKLLRKRSRVAFMNAYPAHEHLFNQKHIQISEAGDLVFSDQFPRAFKKRISVSTCMMICSGLYPHSMEDIQNREAIYQDFSNQLLIKAGLDLPVFSPPEAADILKKKFLQNDFLFYEYFLTDLFGHRKEFADHLKLINNLNLLLEHLILNLDPGEVTLILTSDHGNIEDFTTRAHTRNPVPLLVWGKDSRRLRERINSITDVTPAILEAFD
jgi:hypothetical protein